MPPTSPRGSRSTCARSNLDPCPGPPTAVSAALTTGRAPTLSHTGLPQWPHHRTGGGGGQGSGRERRPRQRARAAGPRRPSSPHAGPVQGLCGGCRCLMTATAALLLATESAAVAAVWLGRKVSGTEVYFQELTVGPCPPSPTLCPLGAHSQGLSTGGQEVEISLSHSPLMSFLS